MINLIDIPLFAVNSCLFIPRFIRNLSYLCNRQQLVKVIWRALNKSLQDGFLNYLGCLSSYLSCYVRFTHYKPNGKTSQEKAGKSLGKSWERISVATGALVGWASAWRWRACNHRACPHTWGPCTVPSCCWNRRIRTTWRWIAGGIVDCGRRGVQGSTQRMVRMGSKMNGWRLWMRVVIYLPDTRSSIV